MRGFKLAGFAAQAELLRLRLMLRRHVVRAVMGGIAAVFLIGMLIGLHVAGAIELTRYVPTYQAALIVAAVDLVIGIIFMLLAMRDTPSAAELEAMQVRKAAQAQMMEAAALTTLIGPLLRMIGTRKVYGLALAALTARFLGGAR